MWYLYMCVCVCLQMAFLVLLIFESLKYKTYHCINLKVNNSVALYDLFSYAMLRPPAPSNRALCTSPPGRLLAGQRYDCLQVRCPSVTQWVMAGDGGQVGA